MASYLDRDNYGMYKDTDKQGPGPALMGADTLLGNDVVNGQEESLGDIKEIMIDMRTGHIAYAVLAFGGFLGIGEKLFAVPWQALKLDTENHRFTLNVPKDRLESAPGFDKDRWPDMTDVTWQEQIHEFYGTEPYSSHTGGAGLSGGISGGTRAPVGGASMGAGGSLGAGHAGHPGSPLEREAASSPTRGGHLSRDSGAGSNVSGGSRGGTLGPDSNLSEPGSGSISHSNYQEPE